MAKSKLFADWIWRQEMPIEFADTSVQLKRSDVFSKYNSTSSKQSSMHAPTLRALLTYAALVNATEQGDPMDGLGAIGSQNDDQLVAEYLGAKPECVVFNKRNCRFIAGLIRTLGETACSGEALLFTLMPLFLDDDEFSDGFKELCDAARNGYPDLASASRAAILLCDNVYRRIENHAALRKDGVKVEIPSTGNLSQLTEMAMANNTYAPTAVLYGEFRVFQPGASSGAPSVVIDHSAFAGQYRMSDRSFSAAETGMIPVLPDWYVIPKEVEQVCRHIAQTTGSQSPMRNIMFRGPAGTGKTDGAKAIAAGLGIPYTFLTCSANTEVFDLLGQVLPKMDGETEICSGLPSLMDIQMDPASAYCQMTGEYRADITENEVLQKMVELRAKELGDGSGGGSFRYVDTPLVKAIDRLLSSVAEDRVNTRMEQELTEELQAEANHIHYGNAHLGVHVTVNRMSVVPEHLAQEYSRVSAPLLLLSKRMQKQVLQVLKDRRQGGKQNGFLMGRRLEARSLVRNDGRYFYKNNLPQEKAELAVALLVDESGSMCCLDRITTARAASIVIYDFCKRLHIPVMIMGHTAGGKQVELFSYADFHSIDGKDCCRMMDMSARGCNRDGAALRYVAEQLVKRPEQHKLLILISDGQPNDDGYSGTGAEADLRGIRREYTNKGVTLFAAAIGDDRQNIERIYQDGYLDITDLNQLPQNLAKLIARYIRVA